jgi:hypothetical protein
LQALAIVGQQIVILGADIFFADRNSQGYIGLFKPGDFFGYSHFFPLLFEAVPKLQFWNSFPRFNGKTGLRPVFPRACSETNRVLEQAHLLCKYTNFLRKKH